MKFNTRQVGDSFIKNKFALIPTEVLDRDYNKVIVWFEWYVEQGYYIYDDSLLSFLFSLGDVYNRAIIKVITIRKTAVK